MTTFRLLCRRFEREDILSLVDPGILSEIKARDPAPILVGYVVAGNGTWHPVGMYDDNGPDVGEISLDAEQVAQVAELIRQKIKSPHTESLRMWQGHTYAGSDTEHDNQPNRPALAFVVGVGQSQVDGNTSAVVAAYFPPESAQYANAFPAVSLEMKTMGRQVIDWAKRIAKIAVERVTEVTGIALLKDEKPAYSGARRMGVIYAQHNEPGTQGAKRMDLETVPFSALMAELKRRNLHPTQAYQVGEIVGERHVLPDGKVKWIGGDREVAAAVDRIIAEERERVTADFSGQLQEAKAQIEKLKPLESEVVRARAVPELVKKAKAMNDPVFAARIERRASKFNPNGPELEKAIDDFIASEKAEYDEDRKELARTNAPGANLGGADTGRVTSDKKDDWLGVEDVPEEFMAKRG